MKVSSQTRIRLAGINRLLSDVYSRPTQLGDLLGNLITDEQFCCIRDQHLDAFVSLFCFALRCRFPTYEKRRQQYRLLQLLYGIEDGTPRSHEQASTLMDISVEDVLRMEQIISRRISPTDRRDILWDCARMATEEILGAPLDAR